MSQYREPSEHANEALILTICLAGGLLLLSGWFVVAHVIPYVEKAFVAALN